MVNPDKILFALVISLWNLVSVAQPVADFSSSAYSGCSPLTGVQFTDLSSGNPTTWLWKKNGVQFSTLQNPTSTFTSPGTYSVSLTAGNSQGSATISKNIVVYTNPTSSFSSTSSTAGCNPLKVDFLDNSTATGTSIKDWLWSFGDGGQDSVASPSHTYTLSGNFPVSLKVIDYHGCEDTKQIPNYVQVYPLPNASFSTSSIRLACAPPLSVSFSNSSTGTGSLSYLWNFGDGNSSVAANPSHTYLSYGNFDVKLTVTDNNACSNSLTYNSYVIIQPIQADFTISDDSICFGDSVTFVQSASNAIAYNWDFGDQTGATGPVVSHTYLDSGLFVVRLIATIGTIGCSDTMYKTVYAQQVVAGFMPNTRYLCQLPQWVHYNNTSVNGDYYEWRYGINCPNITGLPYNSCGRPTTNDSMYYHINARSGESVERVFDDTLIAISFLGCRDTMVLDSSVTINLVRSGPILTQFSGCRPLPIGFSYIDWPYDPLVSIPKPAVSITSYEWIIDDTLYSALKNPPILNVTDTGIWMGELKVENSLGCRDSIGFGIMAGDTPTVDFVMTHDTICFTDFDTAISLAQDTTYINRYIWSTLPHSNIGYEGRDGLILPADTGWHSVIHIADHHGCRDTLIKQNVFYVNGPFVLILGYSPFTCIDTTKVILKSDMRGASTFKWNFGHPSVPDDSINANPVVNYPVQNNYVVYLTAYNGDSSCVSVDNIIVGAWPTKAIIRSTSNDLGFNPPVGGAVSYINDTLEGCVPLTVHFNGLFSPGLMVCDWLINGQLYQGYSLDSVLTKTFTQRGFYDVYMIGYDTVGNCIDTSHMVVAAYKPQVDFVGNPNSGCTPLSVLLEENTSSLAGIKHFIWKVDLINDTGSTYTKTYNSVTNKDVKLIVIDSFGCTDSLKRKDFIKATSFDIYFYATGARQLCTGDSIDFLETLFTQNISYTWAFGDGDTSHLPAPYHTYNDSGTFDVTLYATDSAGCVKIHERLNYIEVQMTPTANFSADRTDSTCYPLPVQFTADTNIVYYNDNSYFYTLGDFQAASNYKDPFYNYVKPGSYTVSLLVTTSFGCRDTLIKTNYINVNGPYGEMTVEPDSICRGDSVTFEMINSSGLTFFSWDFGDGTDTSGVNPASHTYRDSFGMVFPNLVLTDAVGGCAKSFEDTIYIYETIADISFSDSIGCVSYNPGIVNTSTKSSIYYWDFGNGKISTGKNPFVTYTQPGTYTVILRVENNVGCKDTLEQRFYVHPIPDAYVETDTLICEGDSVQLFASGGETYKWRPPSYLSNPLIYNPFAYPVLSGAYNVLVTDTNNCKDSATVQINVQNPVYVDLDDLILIIGDTITLYKGFGGPGVKYKWNPPLGLSCDTCPKPLLTALVSGEYTVAISDTNGCFEAVSSFYLEVSKKYSIDVPSAFTPNGDGVNDVIYVRGWGIKDLLVFQIYNRWGELVFETSNLSVGWDGTYKGELQGVETFVYYVEGLTYGDEVLKKKGSINLLR